jgi:maltose alpha-D-glucosyltransferase/alpha-amylase
VPVAGAIEYFPAAAEAGKSVEKSPEIPVDRMTLALLQGYVENQGDGWSYTLAYLERFFEHLEANDTAAADMHGAYLTLVRTLARRTAELHLALARPTGDPAFDPETIGAPDLDQWTQVAGEEAVESLDRLESALATLPAAARAPAEALLAQRQALSAQIASGVPEGFSGLKIRHHGDYHLGQVLVAQNDFIIIDFEGEPTRSPEQRRQKSSPLRDVAGMLRSFDYAARTALAHAASEAPKDMAGLEAQAIAWQQEVERAFLLSYAETVAAGDAKLYGKWSEAQHLLELFVLEKALYELRYELAHRPDWVQLPLLGILAVLGASPGAN